MINPFWLLCFLLFVSTCDSYNPDRIRLTDISVLTLNADEYTNARRGKRYPQVKCVGGSAKRHPEYHPKVFQCYNRGDDGYDVQWECKADLPSYCSFGKMRVSCEGYDSSKDPFVLRGSCSLEYELDCKKLDRASSPYFSSFTETGTETASFLSAGLGIFTMIALLLIIYFCCISTGQTPGGNETRTPYEAGMPPSPGFNIYPDLNDPSNRPPAYDDPIHHDSARYRGPYGETWNKNPTSTFTATDTNNGPGFWSGALLGGLAGYVFGNHGTQSTYHNQPHSTYYSSTSTYHEPGTNNDTDEDHRTASGFATTTRR